MTERDDDQPTSGKDAMSAGPPGNDRTTDGQAPATPVPLPAAPHGDAAGSGPPPGSSGRPHPATDDITEPTGPVGAATALANLRKLVEAILIVADQPVTDVEIAQVCEQPRAAVATVLRDLARSYADDERGFVLREVAGGWRLYSAADCAAYVERFVLEGQQTRLTQAALETLAVVAYRQPVTRAAISAIRGVNVEGVIRTLVARGLVEEVGQESSGAVLYATTTHFLSRLGLNSLDELPSLAPFLPVDVDAIAEQL